MRIGIGHDTHRLGNNTTENSRPLLIGGVEIPFDRHLIGHSDADVLLHAVTDALLGAAALGDIGEMFPDTATENKGRDSSEMLQLAYARVQERGWRIANIDCIVFAQAPKLSPYKEVIQKHLAALLQAQPDQVGVKAKTGEHAGPIGRGEIIAAEAVALLQSTT